MQILGSMMNRIKGLKKKICSDSPTGLWTNQATSGVLHFIFHSTFLKGRRAIGAFLNIPQLHLKTGAGNQRWIRRVIVSALGNDGYGSHAEWRKELGTFGVPAMAQWKWIQLGIMRLWVQSLTSISGLRIQCCCELWCTSQTWLGSCTAVAVA